VNNLREQLYQFVLAAHAGFPADQLQMDFRGISTIHKADQPDTSIYPF
jgi:hypothetical protein